MGILEYGGAIKLNSANCNEEKEKKLKQIFICLPNLQECLIKIQSFQSLCLKIRVNKLKRHTL